MARAKAPPSAVVLHTSHAVYAAILRYFEAPAFAVFPEVSNATGSRASRWADALAIGLWPSRGLYFHGVEIKVSRSDLVRELKDPAKAEAIASYCDYWWIAVGSADIVKDVSELPATWGLLVPAKGKADDAPTLRIAKQAVKMEPKEIGRTFIAAIIRRVSERFDEEKIKRNAIADFKHSTALEIEAQVREEHGDDLKRLTDELALARQQLEDANRRLQTLATGCYRPEQVSAAIKFLTTMGDVGWHNVGTRLKSMMGHNRMTKKMLDDVDAQLLEMKDLAAILRGDDPDAQTEDA